MEKKKAYINEDGAMEFDWVRVYVNGDYKRDKAKNIFY